MEGVRFIGVVLKGFRQSGALGHGMRCMMRSARVIDVCNGVSCCGLNDSAVIGFFDQPLIYQSFILKLSLASPSAVIC